jgi:hypothetical protein
MLLFCRTYLTRNFLNHTVLGTYKNVVFNAVCFFITLEYEIIKHMFIVYTRHVEKRPKKPKEQFQISNPAQKKIGKN